MFELNAYIDTRVKVVNDALSGIFHDKDAGGKPLEGTPDSGRVQEAMIYSLMAGGKRIRPILCIASAEAVGAVGFIREQDNENRAILKAACALEVLHTYSLIHDDLPAMDDDELRRGKPTCHMAYDEATAILAGDALLTLAFELLSTIDIHTMKDAKALLGIIHRISRAAGYQGMIEGQMRDVIAENRQLSLAGIEGIHTLKTGALIEAAVYTGALLGGGNEYQNRQLGIYARNIGLAFQVADDILNVEGDAEKMGKAVGTDAHRDKNTYPSLLGIDNSKAFAVELVNNALKVLEDLDSRSDPLRAIASYIIERNR